MFVPFSLFEEHSLLQLAAAYLQETVAPEAARCDLNPQALHQALQGLGERSLLALRLSKQWGGTALNAADFHKFQWLVARYSGALAFLQTQHQSAAALLAHSDNQLLKTTYLPQMATGKALIGIGFSHLRRPGKPLLSATPVTNGYLLKGQVPWITGYNHFHHVIVAATLDNSQVLYGLIPFHNEVQATSGSLRYSPPMELVAVRATNTVTAQFHDWFLPVEQLVALKPATAIHINDRQNVLNHSFLALGCAQAGLDILYRTYAQQKLPILQQLFSVLQAEYELCFEAIFQAVGENKSFEQRCQLRATAITLAARCSHAAVVASSGAANYLEHAAGRVYREALLFSVAGQTAAVKEETLKQLLSHYQFVYN